MAQLAKALATIRQGASRDGPLPIPSPDDPGRTLPGACRRDCPGWPAAGPALGRAVYPGTADVLDARPTPAEIGYDPTLGALLLQGVAEADDHLHGPRSS